MQKSASLKYQDHILLQKSLHESISYNCGYGRREGSRGEEKGNFLPSLLAVNMCSRHTQYWETRAWKVRAPAESIASVL